MPYERSDSPREGMFKKPILSEGSRPALSEVEGKAAAVLTRGAYALYVSANAAKNGKSVSPKAAKGRPCLAEATERRWRRFDQGGVFSTFPQGETDDRYSSGESGENFRHPNLR